MWTRRLSPPSLRVGRDRGARLLPLALGLLAACGGTAPEPPLAAAGDLPAGRLGTAVEVALAAVRDEPADAGARFDLAAAYDAAGLHDLAERTYGQVLALDPRHPRAWYHRARTRRELGRTEESLADAVRAAELAPRYAPAHWRLGLWLAEVGRGEEAAACFARAVEVDPGDPGGWLGRARLALEAERHGEAIEVLEELLGRDPANGYARHLLGTALLAAGEDERAERELARAAGSRPEWRDPWVEEIRGRELGAGRELTWAWEEINAGRAAEVLPALERMNAERPADIAVLGALAAAYCGAGGPHRALALLEEARGRQPGHHRIELLLSFVHELGGDLGRAREHLERAAALHPEFAETLSLIHI